MKKILPAILLFIIPISSYSSTIPDKYDETIKLYVNKYLPEINWKFVKAQLFLESSLNPRAKSKCGAKGIAQFMDGTWLDVKRKLKFPNYTTPYHSFYSIKASVYYLSSLYKRFKNISNKEERLALALASYNAGYSNIIKAGKLAKTNRYNILSKKLYLITSRENARETITYVYNIFKLMKKL